MRSKFGRWIGNRAYGLPLLSEIFSAGVISKTGALACRQINLSVGSTVDDDDDEARRWPGGPGVWTPSPCSHGQE